MLVSVKFKNKRKWVDMYADNYTLYLLMDDEEVELILHGIHGNILYARDIQYTDDELQDALCMAI